MASLRTKAPGAFRTISEVAEELDLRQHVLRFWETRFPQVKPVKRGGGRRYYRTEDVELLKAIRALLYDHKITIKGVQKLLREQGVKALVAAAHTPQGMALKPASASAAETAPAPGGGSLAATLNGVLAELVAIRRLLQPVAA